MQLILSLMLIVAVASLCNCLDILDVLRAKRQLPLQPNEITADVSLMPPDGAQPFDNGLQQELTTPNAPSDSQPEFDQEGQTEQPPPPARVDPPNPQRNGPQPNGNPPRMGNPQPQNANSRRPPMATATPSAGRSQPVRAGLPGPGRNTQGRTQSPSQPAENSGRDAQNARRFPPLGQTQNPPRPGENNIPDARNPGQLPPRLQPSGPNRSRFPGFRGQNTALATPPPPPLAEELNPADNPDPEVSGSGDPNEGNDGESIPEPTETPRPPGRANSLHSLPSENNGPRPGVSASNWPRPINGTRARPTPAPQPVPESDEAPDTFTEEGLLAAMQASKNEVSDNSNAEDEQPPSTNRPQPAQASGRPPPEAGILAGGRPGNQVGPDRNTGNGRKPSSSNGGNVLPPRFVPRNNSQPANRNAPGGGNIPNGRGQPLGGNGGRQDQLDRQDLDAPRPADPDHSPNDNNHNQEERPDNEDVDNMNNDNIDSGSANDLGRSSSLAKPQPFTPPVPTNRNRTPNRQPANPTRSPLGSRPQTQPPRISGRPGIPLPPRQEGPPFIRPLERTTAPPQAAQQGGGPFDEAFTQPTPRRPIFDPPSESTNDNSDGADLANSNNRPDQSDEAGPVNVQPLPAAQFRPAPAPGRQDPAADRNVIPDSVRRDSTELDKPKQEAPQQAPRGSFSQTPPNASATPRPLPMNSRLPGSRAPTSTRSPPVRGPQRRPGMPNRTPVNGGRQVNPDASNSNNNNDNNIQTQHANPHNDPGSAASGDADSLPPGFAPILNSNGQPQRNVANNARSENPAPAPKDPFSQPRNENPENPDSWS